jgi:acyl dehydratase
MGTTFGSPDELLDSVGRNLGTTEWLEIDQDRIDAFAGCTGDHQWIHVDTERAAAGPFGATIAHGYLTLALTNVLLPDLITVENISMGINYGTNKVRFPNPVRVGSRIRGTAEVGEVSEIPGGVQVIIKVTVEIENEAKPACVVESVTRYLR